MKAYVRTVKNQHDTSWLANVCAEVYPRPGRDPTVATLACQHRWQIDGKKTRCEKCGCAGVPGREGFYGTTTVDFEKLTDFAPGARVSAGLLTGGRLRGDAIVIEVKAWLDGGIVMTAVKWEDADELGLEEVADEQTLIDFADVERATHALIAPKETDKCETYTRSRGQKTGAESRSETRTSAQSRASR